METMQKKEKETCHRKDRNYPNQFPIWCKDEKQGNITLCTNLLITQGGRSFNYFGLKGTNMETFTKLHTFYFSQGGRISTLG